MVGGGENCVVAGVSWSRDEIDKLRTWVGNQGNLVVKALYELGAEQPDEIYSFQDVTARARGNGDQRSDENMARSLGSYSRSVERMFSKPRVSWGGIGNNEPAWPIVVSKVGGVTLYMMSRCVAELWVPASGLTGSKANRNPNWSTDELMLALDLYFGEGQLSSDDPQVIELSELLNSLPIHTVRPDIERFRNPNGVALKLANFAALDPAYSGVGMARGGRLDAEVWDRFNGKRDELHRLVQALRDGKLVPEGWPSTHDEDEGWSQEGVLSFRTHRFYERDRRLVARKKRAARVLDCEVCGFNFRATYGVVGTDFIECHHLLPLSAGVRSTRLEDLILICSNCHRMAHRIQPWPNLASLRNVLRKG